MQYVVAGRVSFYDLADLLEKIIHTHLLKIKKLILSKFIDSWRTYHKYLHSNEKSKTNDSFYPALRMILPDYERERIAYGVKEMALAHLYIKALSIPKDGIDAKRLLHYKDLGNDDKSHVDFADIAFQVLKERCPEHGNMSIESVNECLDNIAINKAIKNRNMIIKNLSYMLKNMSAMEQKWLIRIILKKVSIGLSPSNVLKLYHPDAAALFNVSNDLEKLCLTLRDPNIRVKDIHIKLFIPFKPMLAERSSHYSVMNLIKEEKQEGNRDGFIIETKFDGERTQIHYSKKEGFKYFSRRGYDYTASYGPSQHEGLFTPIVHGCFGMDVESCILDGEMVGYHKATNTIEKPTLHAKSSKTDLLTKTVPQVISHYLMAVRVPNRASDRRDRYMPICVVGSGFSDGDFQGLLFSLIPHFSESSRDSTHLVLGLRSYRPDLWIKSSNESVVLQVKASNIILRDIRVDVPSDLKDDVTYYVDDDINDMGNEIEGEPSLKVVDPDIEPEKLYIKLKYPRLEKIRLDKSIHECTTLYELVAINNVLTKDLKAQTASHKYKPLRLVGKLHFSKHDPQNPKNRNLEDHTNKRKRFLVGYAKPLATKIDEQNLKLVSSIFNGKEFYIINDFEGLTKADLERECLERDANIVQIPGINTTYLVAGNMNAKINNYISSAKYDIVKASWLLRCIQNEKYIDSQPRDMIYMKSQTQKMFQSSYDLYGDSYCEDVDAETLESIMDRIFIDDEDFLNASELLELKRVVDNVDL
ncbi:DNA ligase 4-like isoform X2 [Gordionus sp. m RMFG-2023]|uniref:DNA ligase 4-like isoform X2 n=1 Tax=Gordionus sp. m RMFG-2023 TaxID=3053472 RepID=UPI0031FC06EA